jgi:HEAT repeat protein
MIRLSAKRFGQFVLANGILCLGFGIAAAKADQPRFVNAKLETRAETQRLESLVEQIAGEGQQAQWIAYGVDAIAGEHSVCCENDRGYSRGEVCGTCILEREHGNSLEKRSERRTMELEGREQLIVLLRLEKGRVMRIRLASEDCTLDAGGLRVVWLTGVKPEESVALLTKYVGAEDFDERNSHGMSEEALTAIALHADASADRAFASFVGTGQRAGLREKASFWLGAARGKQGLAVLEKMAKSDPSPQVREKVTFALSVSPEAEAQDEMMRMAHDDADAAVRGQALFWLAQKAGKKAESAISGAIQNDPDTEVKKKAVFALSQMPKEQGIPKLIEVAQTNKNPEVRKQAMFWLGQSGDPRALAFFEKVLSQ